MINEVYYFLIGLVSIVVVSFLAYKWIINAYSPLVEKILLSFSLIVIDVIYIVYYLDLYNIPTIFQWTNNIDTKTWLNCIFMILSAAFGGVVVLVSTKWQMDEADKKSRKLNKGVFRIDKMSDDKKVCRLSFKYLLYDKTKRKSTRRSMIIRNIGKSSINEFILKTNNEKSRFEVDAKEEKLESNNITREKMYCYDRILPGESVLLIIDYDKDSTTITNSFLNIYYADDCGNYCQQIIDLYDWKLMGPYDITPEIYADMQDY